jgi:hypothetical protein
LMGSLSYTIAFGTWSVLHFVRIIFGGLLLEFFILGCLMASIIRWYANKFMRVTRLYTVEQTVEWLYAFDIHCNGCFPSFCLLFAGQYFLLPIILNESFLATLIANTLYAVAATYYLYITFLGYSCKFKTLMKALAAILSNSGHHTFFQTGADHMC